MILPQPRQDERQKRLAALTGTILLLAMGYAVLHFTGVPVLRSSRAMIRELNPAMLARYSPKPPSPSPTPETPPPPEPTAPVLAEAEVEQAMNQLMQRFETPGAPATGTQRATGQTKASPSAGLPVETPGLSTLFGERPGSLNLTTVTRNRSARHNAAGQEGLKLKDDTPTPSRSAPPSPLEDLGARVTETGSTRQPAPPLPSVDIQDHAPETYENLDLTAFVTWMRQHPAPLAPGVKVHLGYQPAFLSSVVSFLAENRAVELYLMYKESLEELHIVLVEGERSIYLIDHGFKERSLSLREGAVKRLNAEIMTIDSRSGDATGQRARAFYSIFLSWWEQTRQEIEP